MSQMDHAAAHERIEDLLLEPARLAGLDRSTRPRRRRAARAPRDAARAAARTSRAGPARPRHRAGAAAGRRRGHRGRRADRRCRPRSGRASSVPSTTLPRKARRTRRDRRARLARRSAGRLAQRRARRLAPWLGLAASLIVIVGASWITARPGDPPRDAPRPRRRRWRASSRRSIGCSRRRPPDRRAPRTRTARPPARSRGRATTGSSSRRRSTEPAADQRYRCWLEEGDRSARSAGCSSPAERRTGSARSTNGRRGRSARRRSFVVTLEAAGAQDRTGTPASSRPTWRS